MCVRPCIPDLLAVDFYFVRQINKKPILLP